MRVGRAFLYHGQSAAQIALLEGLKAQYERDVGELVQRCT
jgi:hypothetical protein